MPANDVEVLQGTLDLLVLKALTWRPMHGYDILEWLRRTTAQQLRIEDAALYPALHRLEARGWLESEWGLSANNRRARYYKLNAAGRKALREESRAWERYVALVSRLLAATQEG